MTKFFTAAAFAVAFSAIILMGGSNTSLACTDDCDIPNSGYEGGNQNFSAVTATACLPKNIRQAITLDNGYYAWTRAIGGTKPSAKNTQLKGKTSNRSCWTQESIRPGAWMATYITCDEFTGWIAWKVPSSGGKGIMVPVRWKFLPKWM